jgi:hypothetical protein
MAARKTRSNGDVRMMSPMELNRKTTVVKSNCVMD